MTHEFLNLVQVATEYHQNGHKTVLATVVALEGSSYRRPGVRMLLSDHGRMEGAVSGGCVEKEVQRQAEDVFKKNAPKMMAYDGRFRLGCEGTIYILLEPFAPSQDMQKTLEKSGENRQSFEIVSRFSKTLGVDASLGSILVMDGQQIPFYKNVTQKSATSPTVFRQSLAPCFKLLIFGAEHDAVALCKIAAELGWEVTIIADPDESKTITFFPGAKHLLTPLPGALPMENIDAQTAVVLMSHSFNKDLNYLIALKETRPAYFGLLGPAHRRERLFNHFLELHPETDAEFIEAMHGPSGLNIGAESATEIAVSIVSEILSATRQQNPIPLRDKTDRIHA